MSHSASQSLEGPALASLRCQFPILEKSTYLISNSLGAMPAEVTQELAAYSETWATRGVRAWEEAWWTLAADLGDRVAPLIGAGPGEIVFQPGVTVAHAIILSALEASATRTRVVTDALHFPSILYLLQAMPAIELVVVPSQDGVSVDPERLIDAIDERTLCVALSHVLFKSAYVHDLAPIANRARAFGALTIIDGYQAVGTIPVDVRALGVDAYIGGCLKWLCGGPGAAFLWVDPAHRRNLTPRLTGWLAHRHPFAFTQTLERREDAWRFLQGTPNISALYAARPGIELISSIGVGAIRAKSIRQTTRILELAAARGWSTRSPADPRYRGGTVALDVPDGLAVSRALKRREILCDYRPEAGIRLSPHFYTKDDEIASAIESIASILEDRSWHGLEHSESPVT